MISPFAWRESPHLSYQTPSASSYALPMRARQKSPVTFGGFDAAQRNPAELITLCDAGWGDGSDHKIRSSILDPERGDAVAI